MRKHIAVTALLASLLPANASAREYQLWVGTSAQHTESTSVDAVNDGDTMALGDFTFMAGAVDFVPILGSVAIELRWQLGNSSALDFHTIDTDLSLHSLRAGVVANRRIATRLRAFGRADAGFMTGFLSMSTYGTGGQSTLEDRAWAACGYAGGGVEWTMFQARPDAPNPDLAFALRLEAGYLSSGGLAFAANPVYPDDGMAHLDTAAAPLGTLDPSGWTIGFGFSGRW